MVKQFPDTNDKLVCLHKHFKSKTLLARQLGISYRHITRFFNGEQAPTEPVRILIDLRYDQVQAKKAS